MFKSDFSFERLLEVVMPGSILSIGLWYLHRPFLAVYFPTVASSANIISGESGAIAPKATVFLVVTLVFGVLLRNPSDIAVASVFSDESDTEKAIRIPRKILWIVMTILLMSTARDPRVHAIDRYLRSPRRPKFLALSKDWGFAVEEILERNEEKVAVHQHIVSRLRVQSSEISSLVREALHPVSVFASILLSLVTLFALGMTSFATNALVEGRAVVQPTSFIVGTLACIYVVAWLCAFTLRRAMKHFAASIVTLALHRYDERA